MKPRVKIEAFDDALKVTVEGVDEPARWGTWPARKVFEYSVPGIIASDLADILAACGIETDFIYEK